MTVDNEDLRRNENLENELTEIWAAIKRLPYMEQRIINGMEVFFIKRPTSIIATWATEERFYVLTVNVPKEEAIAIIEGVRRIAD